MVTFDAGGQSSIDIVLNMIANTKGINLMMNDLKTMQRTVQDFNKLTPQAQQEFFAPGQIESIRTMEKQLQGVKMATQDMSGSFDMASLGLMFAGMQLSAIFGGLFRTLASGFGEAQSANSAYNQQMSELNARFEYFKFLLFDAFANSAVFDAILGGLNWVLDRLIALPEPVKAFIVVLTGLLAALGTIMFAVFSIDLAVKAWKASVFINAIKAKLIPALTTAWIWAKAIALTLKTDAVTAAGSLASKFGRAGAAGTILGSVLGIAVGIAFIAQMINKASQYGWNWGDAFKFTANQAGILLLQLLRGLGTVFKWLSQAVTVIGGLIIDGILGSFRWAFNGLIDFVLPIFNLIDSVLKTNFSGTLKDAKFGSVWNTDVTYAGLTNVESGFANLDSILQERIDELQEYNRIIDSQNGVNRGTTTTIIEQTNNVSIPSDELRDYVFNQIDDASRESATRFNVGSVIGDR